MSAVEKASPSLVAAERSPGQFGNILTEWRYAWRPGLTVWLGSALAYSVWASVASLFVEPLQATFGWSRGDIAYAGNAGMFSALAAPFLGRLVDRVGARPVLLTGLVLTAACYVMFSRMSGSLGVYYALYFAFVLVGLATTGLTYTRIIIGAFNKSRGSALAIGRSGLAISGAVMPAVIYVAIQRWGFSGGYLALAALIVFVLLPISWAWVPKTRENAKGTVAQPQSEHWSLLIRRPKVIIICLAGALNYAPVVAILSQAMPLATAKGLGPAAGIGAVSIIGVAALGGTLIGGLLVDRLWAPAVAFVINIISALGCLLLLSDQVHPLLFYAAAVMVGLSQGAELDIVAFMISRYFGLRSYATIYGMSVLTIGVMAALGISTIGALYDVFGSYNIALIAASASFTAAAGFYLLMGRYPDIRPD